MKTPSSSCETAGAGICGARRKRRLIRVFSRATAICRPQMQAVAKPDESEGFPDAAALHAIDRCDDLPACAAAARCSPGSSFRGRAAARPCWSPGATAPASPRCCGSSPGCCGLRPARSTLDGRRSRAPARRAGALPRPSGRAEAGADGGAKICDSGAAISAAADATRERRPRAVGLARPRRPARRLSLRRAAAAAVDRAAGRRARARSGCSTSRPRRSTPPRSRRLAELMREHLAGGGMIVAATPWPDRARVRARELRIGSRMRAACIAAASMNALRCARHAARHAARVRVGGGALMRRAVLSDRGGAGAVRDRSRPRAAARASARRSCGSARCWRACSRSTACSPPTTRTARST